MSDLDRWGLRGPVRTCLIEWTTFSQSCGTEACSTEESRNSNLIEFLPDGSVARTEHRNPDGSVWISVWEYERGHLVAHRSGNTPDPVETSRCEYDEQGRLARVIYRNKDGSERVSETYTYDQSGKKTKTWFVDLPAPGQNVGYDLSCEESDLIAIIVQDTTGRLLRRADFTHDQAGRLTQEVHATFPLEFTPEISSHMTPAQLETIRSLLGGSIRRVHKYDDHGRRSETRLQFGPVGSDRTTMTYNDRGDMVHQFNEHESREYAMNSEGKFGEAPAKETVHRSETRIHYDYDDRGNWVNKIVESRLLPDQDFTVTNTERRTIEYYE